MCLAIPTRIKSIEGNTAKVDFGQNVIREVDVSLVDVNVGDYVLVHAGFAIQKLDKQDAIETLNLWEELLESNK